MYDDFKLIDEEKLIKLMNDYNKQIKVKANSFKSNEEKILLLVDFLNKSNHNIDNLINESKNIKNLDLFKDAYKIIKEIVEKISNLYDLTFTNNLENETDENFANNLKSATLNLVSALENLFDIINIEENVKIKNSLIIIFTEIINLLKEINSIDIIKPKIISLFKKY